MHVIWNNRHYPSNLANHRGNICVAILNGAMMLSFVRYESYALDATNSYSSITLATAEEKLLV